MQDTLKTFLEWIVSGVGLALFVPYITQAIKKYLKWDGQKAFVLSAAVSLLISIVSFLVLKYEWYLYFEEYWPVLVAWFIAIFGGSQIIYRIGVPSTGDLEK